MGDAKREREPGVRRRDSLRPNRRSPSIGGERQIFQNDFLRLYAVTADFGDFSKEYFVTDTGRRAGVLAVRDGSVLIVRQYRFLVDGLTWEIPGGSVGAGERPESAAARECLEETGYECRDLRPLVTYYPGLDASHNPTHLFYSLDPLRRDAPQGEVEEVHWVPLARCLEMVDDGAIIDAFTICALLIYTRRFGESGVTPGVYSRPVDRSNVTVSSQTPSCAIVQSRPAATP